MLIKYHFCILAAISFLHASVSLYLRSLLSVPSQSLPFSHPISLTNLTLSHSHYITHHYPPYISSIPNPSPAFPSITLPSITHAHPSPSFNFIYPTLPFITRTPPSFNSLSSPWHHILLPTPSFLQFYLLPILEECLSLRQRAELACKIAKIIKRSKVRKVNHAFLPEGIQIEDLTQASCHA